jgi:hypothetical protein
MFKNKSVFKLIAFSMISCFLLSTQSFALAYSEKDSSAYREGKGLLGVHNSTVKDKGHHKHKEEKIKEELDELVKSEVITKDQEEKIIERFKKKHEERKEEFKKFKSMTESQQKEYIEQIRKSNEKGIFEELIEDKVITKEQADAVKIVVLKDHKQEFNYDKWKSKLDEQVKVGVITQDENDKILEYMKKKAEEKKVLKEKLEKMSPGERKAYFLEKKLSHKKCNLFDELVEQNILSKEKADTLKKAMHKKHESNEKHDD